MLLVLFLGCDLWATVPAGEDLTYAMKAGHLGLEALSENEVLEVAEVACYGPSSSKNALVPSNDS